MGSVSPYPMPHHLVISCRRYPVVPSSHFPRPAACSVLIGTVPSSSRHLDNATCLPPCVPPCVPFLVSPLIPFPLGGCHRRPARLLSMPFGLRSSVAPPCLSVRRGAGRGACLVIVRPSCRRCLLTRAWGVCVCSDCGDLLAYSVGWSICVGIVSAKLYI